MSSVLSWNYFLKNEINKYIVEKFYQNSIFTTDDETEDLCGKEDFAINTNNRKS